MAVSGFAPRSANASLGGASLGLGLSSSNYIGHGSANRQSSYSSLDVDFSLQTDRQQIATGSHLLALVSFNDSDYRFIDAPELWVGTSRRDLGPFQIALGRRPEEWSKLDSEWGLGLWQPRFRWDYLRPENVGLAGLHVSMKTRLVQAWAMASPIYVPDRGAPLDFADGRMQSLSPWSLSPAYTANVFDRQTEIRYSADIPSIADVITHPNASARIRVGGARGGWLSAAYAYKPMNQLLMSYDATLVTTATESYVDARIYPRVSYHHVAAVDAGYTGSNFEAWLSWLGDRPNDTPVSGPIRTSQVVDKAMLLSPSAAYWFGSKNPKTGGKLTATYLRKFGDDPADAGKYADGSSAFDSRYPFQSALIASARTPQWERLTADVKILYDLAHSGSIVSWLLAYDPTENWSIHFATDVLTSWTDEGSDDFIHRYRANDRISGGVTYVF